MPDTAGRLVASDAERDIASGAGPSHSHRALDLVGAQERDGVTREGASPATGDAKLPGKYLNARTLIGRRGLRDIVGWAIAALLLAIYAAMLGRYAVNFPAGDDFTTVLNVPFNLAHALTLREKLADLFMLATEHRFATQRLAAWVEVQVLGGLDFSLLMYLGSALLVLAGVFLLSAVDRDIRPLFAAITVAVLLSPGNYEAAHWTTGALEHFGVVGYALGALYCLNRAGAGCRAAAGVLALAAAGTSAAGLMLVPAGALLLCLVHRWRAALVWTLCGAAVFAVYFIGYERPPYQGSLWTYLGEPLVPLRFFSIAVGGLALSPAAALAIGIALSLFWAWLVGSRRILSLPPMLVACAAFLLLSFAAITWGRAGFGEKGAFLSRYRPYSELLVLVSLASLAWQLSRVHAVRLMWAVLPLSLVWLVASWRHELPYLENFSIVHQTDLDYYAAEGHNVPNNPMPVAFRDFGLVGAKEFGGYDPSSFARSPLSLMPETRALEAKPVPSLWVEPPVVGKRALMVYGHGPGHEIDAVIFLESSERTYCGTLETMPPVALALGKRTGLLWGVYSLAGIEPGRYRLGIGVDNAIAPAVVWSVYSFDVE
jgi:hypothetical protein